MLQFVDTWTNNFAYVGRRATGTDEGDWLVVPPGWAGSEPAGVRGVIDAPTSVVSVVGRIACDGPDDVERVRALQKQLTLTHLEPGTHRTGLPAPDSDVPEQLRFFEQLRVWMADFRRLPPTVRTRTGSSRWGCWRRGLRRTSPPIPSSYAHSSRGWSAAGRAWRRPGGRVRRTVGAG